LLIFSLLLPQFTAKKDKLAAKKWVSAVIMIVTLAIKGDFQYLFSISIHHPPRINIKRTGS